MRVRLCVGATHAPGCHHEQYMAQGVERFLAHPRTRRAIRLALLYEKADADAILLELARVAGRLDGLQECETPVDEASVQPVDEHDDIDVFLAIAHAAADKEML